MHTQPRPTRSRGIESMNQLFAPLTVEHIAEATLARKGVARVVEFGCGEGRALLDLRKRFPQIEIHGINKDPWTTMQNRESLRANACTFGIFTPEELGSVELPFIHFRDVEQGLPFEDGSVDLLLSQSAIYYVKRKDRFFEDVWRVLAPEGSALLHVDNLPYRNRPDFFFSDTPRFEIHAGKSFHSLDELVAEQRVKGFDMHLHTYTVAEVGQKVSWLYMHKNKPEPLQLGLELDAVSSFDLELLGVEDPPDILYGYRSVFRPAS